ncbi:MAG: hypothetical protein ABI333_13085 [bacterium]
MSQLHQHQALCLLALLALPGCGDDFAGSGDAAAADVSCGPGDPTATPHGRVIVATELYGSGGGITAIDLDTQEPEINVALTHDDVTVRWFDHRIWVLNRFGADNVMILDGNDYRLLKQFSVRPGTDQHCNPHDLLFLGSCRAYLSCFEQPGLQVIDPWAPQGEELVGTIDLSSLADDDGIPEVSHMIEVDGLVYAAIDRMDRGAWVPVAPSYLAVLDPSTDSLVDHIALELWNPVGPLQPIPGTRDLVVTMGGDWTGAHSGLERIDTVNRTSAALLNQSELGGILAAFTLRDDGCGHAIVMQVQTYDTALITYCLDGTGIATCVDAGEFKMTDLKETDDGRLLVTDATADNPGVRVFDADTCAEETTAPIPTGFGPGFTNPLLLIPAAEQ